MGLSHTVAAAGIALSALGDASFGQIARRDSATTLPANTRVAPPEEFSITPQGLLKFGV